jgi:TolB protein
VTGLTRVAVGITVVLMATSACTRGGSAAPAPSTNAAAVPGTLLYAPPGSNGKITLLLWEPPGNPAAGAALDDTDALGVTFAPDGKRVAYLHAGATTVAGADGSGVRALLQNDDAACGEPNWAPDGSRVSAAQAGRSGTVATAGGAFTPFPTAVSGCHVVFSGDGSTIAYATGDGRIMVARSDGSKAHAVPKLGADGGPTKRRSRHPMSLSADGKLVAIFVEQGESSEGGDSGAGRALVANEVVDATTGATVILPVAGELQQAYFLPKGGLLVRTQDKDGLRVTLLSTDLKVVGSVAEPTSLTAAVLLGYAAA